MGKNSNYFMDGLEEALCNIDIFCKVLVEKIVQNERGIETNVNIEPMEKLLRAKYVIKEDFRGKYLTKKDLDTNLPKNIIPLPQLEEPLIDVFEENNRIKVLMQHRCIDPVKIYPDKNGVKVCKIVCYNDASNGKVCIEKCKEIPLPINTDIKEINSKCRNDVLEISLIHH